MSDFVEQLHQLSQLHADGSLSDSEFENAKARLLGGNSASGSEPTLLTLQNELAALDRQWTLEREKYKIAGRYNSSIPEPGDGTKSGVVIAVFGGLWTIGAIAMATTASASGAPTALNAFSWIFPVFGVFFIFVGLSKSAEMNAKAGDYQRAEAQYQTRRAELESRIAAHM